MQLKPLALIRVFYQFEFDPGKSNQIRDPGLDTADRNARWRSQVTMPIDIDTHMAVRRTVSAAD